MKNLTHVPETFEGLDELKPLEIDKVRSEAKALAEALASENQSKLAVGEHLKALQTLLKRRFVKFVKANFDMSVASAYRYMDLYSAAKAKMPKPVLEMAVRQGVRLSAKTVKENPPPKTEDKSKIQEYLHTLRPTRVEVFKSNDALLKECVNFCYLRFQQVPNKSKANFQRSLIGMLMTRFGLSNDASYSPVAVPEAFQVKRGRPKAA